MDQNPVILDISSDEEPAFGECKGEDYNWISEFLDDSDDVVVVGETKSKSLKSTVDEGDDDDCIILDGDPEKAVDVGNDQPSEEDDLVIVGQKGQVACRDYPHPRHHCAKYPFSSSAHNVHCDLCHCYVCDVCAPCAQWGNGASEKDHCHATEKDEHWKSLRKVSGLQKNVPSPVEKVPETFISVPLPRRNHTIPALFRSCSSTRVTTPGIIANGRSQHSGSIFNKNGIQSRTAPQQVSYLRVRNNVIRKETCINGGNPVARAPRRVGIAGNVLQMNQPVHGSVNNSIGGHPPLVAPNTCANQNSCMYQITPQTGMGNGLVSSMPPESQLYMQPPPGFQDYNQPIPQTPLYSQPIPQMPLYSQPFSEPQVKPPSEVQSMNHFFNQNQITRELDLADIEKWLNENSSNSQQPPVENHQLHHSILPTCEQLPGSEVESIPCQRMGVTTSEALPVKESNTQCNETDKINYNDLGFENWFPGNQSSGVVSEGFAMPYDLVDPVVPPVPASFDVGMLVFDFETSFNALGNV